MFFVSVSHIPAIAAGQLFFLANGKGDANAAFWKTGVGFTQKASSGLKIWKRFPFVHVEGRV